jgi:hypothetical protein
MSVSRTARSATEEDGGWRKACGWAGRGHMRAALRGRPWTFSALARRGDGDCARVVGTRGRHEVRTPHLCVLDHHDQDGRRAGRASAGSCSLPSRRRVAGGRSCRASLLRARRPDGLDAARLPCSARGGGAPGGGFVRGNGGGTRLVVVVVPEPASPASQPARVS